MGTHEAKKLLMQKGYIIQAKQGPREWKHVIINFTSNMGLVSKICKILIKSLNTKKINNQI